jgi:single-strand DNA-binding protein
MCTENLNSTLIEGTIKTRPEFSLEQTMQKCVFTVVSKRKKRRDGEQTSVLKETEVEIEGYEKIAQSIREYGRRGRGVRVVGFLKQRWFYDPEGQSASRLVVEAEHVEFRPSVKQSLFK